MAVTPTYKISGVQGEDLDLQLVVLDCDGFRVNLSGYGVRGKVKYSYGGNTLLDLQPSINSGVAGEAFVSGIIDLFVPATGMASLPVGRFVYDIERYTGVANATKVLGGSFYVDPEVTT